MQKYEVEKGKHDFTPNDQPWFTASTKCNFEFILSNSMWFSMEDPDYSGGNDVADWNKLGAGLTWFFSGNTSRTAVLAWRPSQVEKNAFEIAAYINPASGKFIAKGITIVRAGEAMQGQLIITSSYAVFKLKKQGESDDKYSVVQLPFDGLPWYMSWAKFYRGIGPWFGGNQPSHKHMEFLADFKY